MTRNPTGERERGRRRKGPSWLGVVLGLAFLLVAGFAVGMVAGVVSQDPGLAWAYFTGDTEEVAWSASGSSPATGDAPTAADVAAAADPQVRRELEAASADVPPAAEAASTPDVAAPAVVAAAKAAPPAPAAPRPPAAVAAPRAGGLAVQVGAFSTSRAAEDLAGSLRSKGLPVVVSPGTQSGESRWRVRVGPYASREEAEATADRLKREDRLPTWILSEDAD